MWDTLLPYVRDPGWPGWQAAAWSELPTVAIDAWAPRVGLMLGDGSARLVTEAELARSRAPFEVHLATAILNMQVHRPLAWRAIASKGVLGLRTRAVAAELVGELATEHLLLPPAITGVMDLLGTDQIALWSPVRGRVRAVVLPRGAEDKAAAREVATARDRFLDPGTSDPVTPAAFSPTRGAEPPLRLALYPSLPRPAYVPRLARIVPGLVLDHGVGRGQGSHRALTTGPHGLRAALGVDDRGRFVALDDVTFAALGMSLDELWPRALAQLASPPIEDLQLFAGGTLIGCRGVGAAVNVLRPEVVAALHQRLGPVVELTLTSARLLTAFRGPLARGTGTEFVEIATRLEAAPGSRPSLSAAVHRLEHGRLTTSWTDG